MTGRARGAGRAPRRRPCRRPIPRQESPLAPAPRPATTRRPPSASPRSLHGGPRRGAVRPSLEVAVHAGSEVGVEDGRRGRSYSRITGARSLEAVTNQSARPCRPQPSPVAQLALVARVEERPEEAVRDRLHASSRSRAASSSSRSSRSGPTTSPVRSTRSWTPWDARAGHERLGLREPGHVDDLGLQRSATFWTVRPMMIASSCPANREQRGPAPSRVINMLVAMVVP